MQSERGRHLDAAIDAAARSLTTGEPSAALRAGVRERIGRIGGHRNTWWLVPAAVAASVAIVALVGRGPAAPGESHRVRPTDVRLTIDDSSTTHVGRTLSGPPDGPDPSTGSGSARTVSRADKARPTPVLALVPAFEPSFEELEPLIPPITIEPLETRLIVVDTSSGVMPIEIEPLQIEPLRAIEE